jgi:hypothetical protein
MRGLVPPAKDNQTAADFLCDQIPPHDPFVRWVVVRPDTLREGDVTEYALHEGLVASLAKADDTNMANVAHFMCELVQDQALFGTWAGKMPVIVNAVPEPSPTLAHGSGSTPTMKTTLTSSVAGESV